ncbi:DUF2027 domain-containing protein [Dysgonomonas sp. 520]|uniref:DUF2027 domain-containing protein n=1 Tax=Dysgonomonas sp. 520 TaxID=2302931 RepID=UPI0013D6B250|nr:DUF2027 domain-containing protein [Dysgonomonas sp. 520]NDW08346.1 DUF2027 domain-containing protein [Dysgonomonas sp. 520]
MKIGDKVRFLNAVGGGIVKGFKGKDLVIVDDDGFDTPVLIRECVVIEPANESQVRQTVKPTEQFVQQTKVEEPVVVEETKEGEQITVCLAYLPVDIKNLSTTGYETYLVNESNYYLSYNYMNRYKDEWNSLASGIIEPNTKIFLEEFEKPDLNDRERVSLQFIAYKKDKPYKAKNPCSVDLKIDTVKFYKLHSFRENDYFNEDAIVYYVMRKDLPEKEFTISAEDLQQAMLQKEQAERREKKPVKKQSGSDIVEVDLHINELLDNTNGLSNKDILDYQLAKFREVMDEYKNKKGQKIVFIHGKGDGVLKNSILKELKEKYKSAYYQDASFKEYGFGATMITIK